MVWMMVGLSVGCLACCSRLLGRFIVRLGVGGRKRVGFCALGCRL
jgi:hypothetical protein